MHQRHFVGRRGTHLEDNIAAAPQRRRVGGNGGAGFHKSCIRQVGEIASALLHDHGKAQFDQFGDRIGDCGYPFFSGENLFGHANALWRDGGIARLHVCLLAGSRKNKQSSSLTDVKV